MRWEKFREIVGTIFIAVVMAAGIPIGAACLYIGLTVGR